MNSKDNTQTVITNLKAEISELKIKINRLTEKNNKTLNENSRVKSYNDNNVDFYKSVIEYQNDLITILDKDHNIIWASPQFLIAFNLKPNDTVKHSFFKFIHPDYHKSVKKALISSSLPPFSVYHEEISTTTKDWNWIDWSFKSITDNRGQIIRIIAIGKNIQDCKDLNYSLKTNLSRYQKAQQIGNIGNWEYDVVKQEFWGSEQSMHILGLDTNTKNYNFSDIENCILEKEKVQLALDDLVNNNTNYDIEYSIITKNTHKKTIRSIAECERDKDGNAITVSGVIMDITTTKQIEEELIKSRERYKTLVSSINDLIFLLDEDDRFIDVHNNIDSPLIIDTSEFLGKKLIDIMPKEVSDLYTTASRNLRQLQESQNYDYYLNTKNGIRWYSATLDLYKDKKCIVAGIRDITKNKMSEQRYSQILKSAMDGFWLITNSGKIIDANEASCKMLNYSKNEMLTMNVKDIESTEGHSFIMEHIQDILLSGHDNFETKYRKKDGTIIDVELSITQLNFEEESRISVFIRDITERKKNHETILDSQNMMQTILKNMPAGFILIDEAYLISQVNEHTCSITGYNEDELVGSFCDIICPKGAKSRSCPIWAGGQDGFTGMDTTVKHKNGHQVPVVKNSQRITIQGKKYIMESFVDISKRIESEKKLKRTDKLLRKIINTTPNSIFIKDREGKYLIANKTLADSHNTTIDKIIGIYDYNLANEWFNTKDYQEFRTEEQKIIDSNKPYFEASAPFIFNDGTTKYFQTLKVPIEIEDGTRALLTSSVDITDSIELNEKLRVAKDHAEESDRLKSAFLANMSHEIRTPMNGILGFSNLLKNQDLTGEQRDRYITIIQRSGARMLNIINDLIDISRIEAGQVEIKLSATDIINQLDYLYNFFKPEVQEKNMELNLHLPKDITSLTINTDREKLYAILTNLIKNAIKYTDKGKIDICLELSDNRIIFSVKDTGIGIPPDRINAIFDRFVQADIEDKGAFEGAGLGLAICKAYSKMINAEIHVVSEDNIGSEFSLSLPNTTIS